ncbi:MAG TPA: hypothetical protein G4O00_06835 [Thermoflexia bacterium]|jgi:hypothetical protein|nr:hypothetical protein [Thermoflexia bacterium]
MKTVAFVLDVVSWLGVTLLVFFLWRIARFYERSSRETAYSWLFLPPMFLLPAGAAFYWVEDPTFIQSLWGDLLLFAGGGLLLFASILLHQVMMGER